MRVCSVPMTNGRNQPAKQLTLQGASGTLHAHPGPRGDKQDISKYRNHGQPPPGPRR